MTKENYEPVWEHAPTGWDWLAQDQDGKWYWYAKQPTAGVDGGVWRSNSRAQKYAGQSNSNQGWLDTLCKRPDLPNL